MKSLRPSLRENKRYLVVKGKDATFENIESVILEFIGVLGFAEAGIKLIKRSSEGVIIAINREALNKVRASFVASDKDLNIVKVSGIVKKVK
jgi:RNase P/RNase MRP subunit POP5